MTPDSMKLTDLLEKAGANDIVRDMVAFVAQPLMELDVDELWRRPRRAFRATDQLAQRLP